MSEYIEIISILVHVAATICFMLALLADEGREQVNVAIFLELSAIFLRL